MRWPFGDGVRTDTDIASTNQVIQFEYADHAIEHDIAHNWSASDTFTLTINASPQEWNGHQQRYIRPEIRQQDGTVLWAPGENLSGPEKTAIPLYADIVGSSWQADPNLRFSFTIAASTFSAGTPGQPIRLRIGSSGEQRGVFFDNVHLSLSTGGGSPYATWATGGEPFDGDANGDGVKDGLAFLLGAATPGTDASGLLPTVSESGGGLVMTFNCLPVSARGGATLRVEHSSDLGDLDPWTATADVVPDATNAVPDNFVTFVVGAGPLGPPALNSVTATIDSAAAADGKLFGRLRATE